MSNIDFIGRYTDRWWGWVPLLDPWPLIRGDIRFDGWEPVADEEVRQMRQARARPAPVVDKAVATVTKRPVVVRGQHAVKRWCIRARPPGRRNGSAGGQTKECFELGGQMPLRQM
jgi:hypothetical protein